MTRPIWNTRPRSIAGVALVLVAAASACTAEEQPADRPPTSSQSAGEITTPKSAPVIQPGRILGLTFVPSKRQVSAPGSGGVTLIDIDRDGGLDIVTQHLLERRVDVRLNAGDGRFPVGGTRSTDLPYEPGSVALADLDGDRHEDLVVSSHDRSQGQEYVHILTGDGTGAFEPASTPRYATRTSAAGYKPDLDVADTDGDGDLDIIVGNGRRAALDVLLGDGEGVFEAGPGIDLPPDLEFYAFGLGYVDGDEVVDLVVTGTGPQATTTLASNGKIVTLLGTGDGTFGSAREIRTQPLAMAQGDLGSPRLLSTRDLTGDGLADLVLGHDGRALLTVLRNRGDGGFQAVEGSPFELPDETYAVDVVDLDLDGRVDLAAAVDRDVVVLLSANTTFVPAEGSPYSVTPGAFRIATGTIDGDRIPDLVATSFEGRSATLLLGKDS